jgi:hypothetical protein
VQQSLEFQLLRAANDNAMLVPTFLARDWLLALFKVEVNADGKIPRLVL